MRQKCTAPWGAALLLLFLLGTPAAGQMSVGLSGGLSLASLGGSDTADDLGTRTGFNVGAFADIPLGGILWLTPGLFYVQKGAEPASSAIDVLAIDYLELPLLLRVGVSPMDILRLSLFLGPTLGFQVRCTAVRPGASDVDCRDDATAALDLSRPFDLGAAFGVGAAYSLSPGMALVATALWDLGITSLDRSPSSREVRNEAILLNLGLAWTVGR